jgi:hypothetical protein
VFATKPQLAAVMVARIPKRAWERMSADTKPVLAATGGKQPSCHEDHDLRLERRPAC